MLSSNNEFSNNNSKKGRSLFLLFVLRVWGNCIFVTVMSVVYVLRSTKELNNQSKHISLQRQWIYYLSIIESALICKFFLFFHCYLWNTYFEQFMWSSPLFVFMPSVTKPVGRLSHSSKATPVPREYVPAAHLWHCWDCMSRNSPSLQEKATGRQWQGNEWVIHWKYRIQS